MGSTEHRAPELNQVYRGSCCFYLVGYHFYTDIERSDLVKARLLDDDSLEMTDIPDLLARGSTSIHADSRGELFLTNISGHVYHLEAGP